MIVNSSLAQTPTKKKIGLHRINTRVLLQQKAIQQKILASCSHIFPGLENFWGFIQSKKLQKTASHSHIHSHTLQKKSVDTLFRFLRFRFSHIVKSLKKLSIYYWLIHKS